MTIHVKPSRVLSTDRLRTLRVQFMAAQGAQRVGARIREARDAKGWTQVDLARAMPGNRLDGPSVSRWERGLVMPTPANIDALAEALDKDVSFFYVEDEPKPGTGDLLGTLSRLDRIEAMLAELLRRVPAPERTPEQIAREAAADRQPNDKPQPSLPSEKRTA